MPSVTALLVAAILALGVLLMPTAARAQALPASVTLAMASTVVRGYVDAMCEHQAPSSAAREAQRSEHEADAAVARALSFGPVGAADNGVAGVGSLAKRRVLSVIASTLGRRGGFYFGKNLARGDITGCKLVGVEFHFE